MARPKGQLQRAIVAIAMGPKRVQERERALADTRTGKYKQMVHVPLSGEAAATPAFVDKVVNWEFPFLYAPLQNRMPFPTPHFEDGIEITAGQGTLIRIDSQVIGWTLTDEQWFVGATVRFTIVAPAADPASTTASPFSAIAHLGFTGWASGPEFDEFQT